MLDFSEKKAFNNTFARFWRQRTTWQKFLIIHTVYIFPILLYSFALISTGNNIVVGDGDYYVQLYTAAHRTVFEFHQFPWWNPWVAGGVPLFANPQFGLISIQSLPVLVFGSALGYKIGLILYLVIGFYGFKRLFEKVFKADFLRSIFLAYTWVFGSYVVYRVGGHYTFLMVGLVPWMLYYFRFRHTPKNWLKLALVVSLMFWTAVHYITLIAVLGVLVLSSRVLLTKLLAKNFTSFKYEVRLFVKIGLLTSLIVLPRLYFVVDYLYDFPRLQTMYTDPYFGVINGLYAIFGPDQYYRFPKINGPWAWGEASGSIGIFAGISLLFTLGWAIKDRLNKKTTKYGVSPLLLATAFVGFFVLGLGDFGSLSPFHIFRSFPVLSSLRVAPRFFMWAGLVCLGWIAASRLGRKRQILINSLLATNVLVLFITGLPLVAKNYTTPSINFRPSNSAFEQRLRWNQGRNPNVPYHEENFTEATLNNYGQTIAGDSLIDTRGPVPSARCSVDEGCPFVSQNATLQYWSPNKLIIKRIAPGPIEIEMNPGERWMVNDKYIFRNFKVVDPSAQFIIDDPAEIITIEYAPRFSFPWFRLQLQKTNFIF